LGIQKSTKDTKVQPNVFNNITSVLKSFGKSQKEDVVLLKYSYLFQLTLILEND